MCRNIRPLFNFQPPASDEEIRAAALQYVRKVSGYQKPSKTNEAAFNAAVEAIAQASQTLLLAMETQSAPRDRAVEALRARERSKKRFPPKEE